MGSGNWKSPHTSDTQNLTSSLAAHLNTSKVRGPCSVVGIVSRRNHPDIGRIRGGASAFSKAGAPVGPTWFCTGAEGHSVPPTAILDGLCWVPRLPLNPTSRKACRPCASNGRASHLHFRYRRVAIDSAAMAAPQDFLACIRFLQHPTDSTHHRQHHISKALPKSSCDSEPRATTMTLQETALRPSMDSLPYPPSSLGRRGKGPRQLRVALDCSLKPSCVPTVMRGRSRG